MIELIHQLVLPLLQVARLQLLPHSHGLALGHRIINHIASHQHQPFAEQKLCEESEHDVRLGISSLPFVVFQVSP